MKQPKMNYHVPATHRGWTVEENLTYRLMECFSRAFWGGVRFAVDHPDLANLATEQRCETLGETMTRFAPVMRAEIRCVRDFLLHSGPDLGLSEATINKYTTERLGV